MKSFDSITSRVTLTRQNNTVTRRMQHEDNDQTSKITTVFKAVVLETTKKLK